MGITVACAESLTSWWHKRLLAINVGGVMACARATGQQPSASGLERWSAEFARTRCGFSSLDCDLASGDRVEVFAEHPHVRLGDFRRVAEKVAAKRRSCVS
jgi:hypothetical protein